jgi:hypothetical protein
MNVREVVERLSLELKTEGGDLEREVRGCYISDLLSDVMANAREGELWITLQTHPNIVAVAALKNLSGIIITNKRTPEEETLNKARSERVTIVVSHATTFEIGGRIYTILQC